MTEEPPQGTDRPRPAPAGAGMIDRQIGPYRIREEIGRGAMGVIYRARHEKLRHDVAIKLLPPHTLATLVSRKQLRREALALARLNHPALTVIHDLISEEDFDGIVMEMIDGVSLSGMLGQRRLMEDEVVRLGVQLADGLAAAHRAGVIHRDLKPANLRVTSEGRLKILDFGLAKRVAGEMSVTEASAPNQLTGTFAYIAPEVWNGELANEASDLFAAGVVLYEMATGVRPWQDLTGAALQRAILELPPTPPRERNPELSPELDAIILRCLEKSPANRFASAQELFAALESLHLRRKMGAAPPRVRRARIAPGWVGAGVALLSVVVIAAVLWPRPATRIDSLAVLPLAAPTGEQAFADVLTDELIGRLGESPRLRVISRTTSATYRNTPHSLPSIARELEVAGIVEGAVHSNPRGRRITIRLFDGATERRIWSREYQEDLSAGQGEGFIGDEIARDLLAKLSGVKETPATPERPVDPIARQLYSRGRVYWEQRDRGGIRQAIALFSKAIARDSLYAVAYSGLADAWASAGMSAIEPLPVASKNARAAAERALRLDPGSSEAHTSMANILQNFEWNWAEANREYRKAIELNPSNATAHHWYANHLALRGAFDESLAEIAAAQRLDPASLPIGIGHGAFLYFARRHEAADSMYRRVAEISHDSGLLQRAMAANCDRLGHEKETAAAVARWIELDYSPALAERARGIYRAAGLPGLLQFLVAALQEKRRRGHEPATHIAELYARLGDKEKAFQWLAVALKERDTELNRLKVDPIFDPLRSDPRFEPLLRAVRLADPA